MVLFQRPLQAVTWTLPSAVSRVLCDSNSVESATQTLHRLTSVERFDEERALEPPVDDPAVVQGFTPMDLHRLPWFYKGYHDGPPRIDLPRRLTATTAGAVDVLAGTADVPRAQLGLSELGRLLFLMSGVTRTAQRPFGRWLFRAAGSAGGRFPLEVYVAVPEGSPLPSGVHWYQPEQHALVTVGPAPARGCPAVVVTGVPWRTGWKYRERGYRHVYWDAGTALSQLLAVAGSPDGPSSAGAGEPAADGAGRGAARHRRPALGRRAPGHWGCARALSIARPGDAGADL